MPMCSALIARLFYSAITVVLYASHTQTNLFLYQWEDKRKTSCPDTNVLIQSVCKSLKSNLCSRPTTVKIHVFKSSSETSILRPSMSHSLNSYETLGIK